MDKKRIILVDDDQTIVESLSAFIRMVLGHEVVGYTDPIKAMKYLESTDNIDLFISDFLMPGVDGIQFLMEARERFPDAPRILLTGYADKENAIKAINLAAIYYYLEKPWSNEELQLIIKNGLERKDLVNSLKNKIAELEETQQALIQAEKLSAIGRVTSMIIHDFKAPLTIITAGADLLKQGNLDRERSDQLIDSIQKQSDKITEMAEELLAFVKGKWNVVLKTQKVNQKSFIKNIVEPLKDLAERYYAIIEAKINYSGYLALDIDKIQRVFNNLFINAVNAAGNKCKIHFTARNDNKGILIEFSDNGPGIDQIIMDTLFDPFVSHGNKQGIGIGLTICRELIKSHNGEIASSNKPGGGAKFTIKLPLS